MCRLVQFVTIALFSNTILQTVVAQESTTTPINDPNNFVCNSTIVVGSDPIYINNQKQDPNQFCIYTFVIPSDSTAFISASVADLIQYDEYAAIYNDFDSERRDNGAFLLAASFWPPSNVYLSVQTVSTTDNIIFIAIIPQKLNNSNISPMELKLIAGVEPYYFESSMTIGVPYVFTSTTKAVLSFVSDGSDFAASTTMSTFVFDGQDVGAPFVGTLESFKSSSFVSKGNSLTVYSMQHFDMGQIIINDQGNVALLGEMNYIYAYDGTFDEYDDQEFTMNATNGPATLTIINDPLGFASPILTSIRFSDPSSVLQVISAFPTVPMAPTLFQYTAANIKDGLDQDIPGPRVTLLLSSGTADVSFSNGQSPEPDNDLGVSRVNRTGYFFSGNYGYPDMDGPLTINYLRRAFANDTTKRFTITNTGDQFKSPDAYVIIWTDDDANTTQTYNNPGSQSFYCFGQSVTMEWYDGASPNMGQVVTFKVEEWNNAITTPAITSGTEVPSTVVTATENAKLPTTTASNDISMTTAEQTTAAHLSTTPTTQAPTTKIGYIQQTNIVVLTSIVALVMV